MTLNSGPTTYTPTKFQHLGFGLGQQVPLLEQTTGADGVRFYNTPSGRRYPSVTTVLSEHSRAAIEAWKERIGREEANRISTRAANRGTGVHVAIERYLNNDAPWSAGNFVNPLTVEMFRSIKPNLDRISNIHCQETRMFSHHLRLAGTADCIGEFDGKLAIIDFKTSTKPKKKEWISSYFMQCSAYAIMYEELTGIPVPKTVIIVSVEDDCTTQVFEERRNPWVPELLSLRDHYEQQHQLLTAVS